MAQSLDNERAIAIVGISCKFKGVDNLQDYWELLKNGENRVTEIPPERWNLQLFYSEDPDAPGKTYVKKAGLIEKFDFWDNQFFGVSDVEAAKMDPQQRWLVECTYRALENAGITRDDVSGTNTGVYIGGMSNEYNSILNKELDNSDAYNSTGGDISMLSARISYLFNLLGPSLSLTTACSSSLVAVHLAIQAIQAGECSLAVCGGVNCILSPDTFIALSKARMLSPTGQCQAFSAQADGYARGEGCGVLILKSLGQAMKDKDHIWATIGTGVNQDGHTTSPITAPSGEQQKALFRQVCKMCSVCPKDIQYFEAHGTGTPVGDPIEATSIGHVIGHARAEASYGPCPIGSVKTNLGHTESAAGIASVIKVLLMMKHGKIVPSLFSEKLNPKINTDELHLHVPTCVSDWKETDKLAAVNSFGYGGTNAHAILKQIIPPSTDLRAPRYTKQREHEVILISAPNKDMLLKTAEAYAAKLASSQNKNIVDLSYATTVRHQAYRWRAAITAKTVGDVLHGLKHLNVQDVKERATQTVFVFSGMGTNWQGMCAELMQTEPNFIKKIEEIDRLLSKYDSWSLVDAIQQKENVTDSAKVQPMLFACQVALANMWIHWGIKPDVILGHSLGEVAASHVAGAIDIDEAVRIIFHRGRLLSKVTGGKMLVVGNYEMEKLRERLLKYEGRVVIAAENSETSCTLSGDSECVDAIHRVMGKLRASGVFLRELSVTTAFHSHHVDPVLKEFRQCLNGVCGRKAKCNLISTVTGMPAKNGDFITALYWEQNMREAVKFGKAIRKSYDTGKTNIIIEVGPRPALSANIKENLSDMQFKYIPSMKPGSEMLCLQQGLCRLYSQGMNINWAAYHSHTLGKFTNDGPELVLAPKQLYYQPASWIRKTQEGEKETKYGHPFVSPVTDTRILTEIEITKETTPFVYDHKLGGLILLPGATYVEIALATVMVTTDNYTPLNQICVSAYIWNRITVSPSGKMRLQVKTEKETETLNLVVETQGDKCASITVDKLSRDLGLSHLNLESLRLSCTNVISSDEIYNILRVGKFQYGEQLSLIMEGRYSANECLTELRLPESVLVMAQKTFAHPAVLDAMNQSVAILCKDLQTILVPVAMEGCRLLRPFEREMTVYLKLKKKTLSEVLFSGALCNKDGTVAFICETIKMVSTSSKSNQQGLKFELEWEEIHDSHIRPSQDKKDHLNYLIIEDIQSSGKYLKRILENQCTKIVLLSSEDQNLMTYIEENIQQGEQLRWCIIVLFSPESYCSNDTSSTVHEEVIRACRVLGDLLKGLQIMQLDLPLYVVTYGSQVISKYDLEHANSMNALCFGPLWAFARSALWEMLYKNLYLVDVGSADETDLSALLQLTEIQTSHFPEFAVREGKLFVNRMSQINRPVRCEMRRKQSFDRSTNILLCSSCPNIFTDPFLVFQEEEPIIPGNIPVVYIRVKKAVIPASFEYPLTVHADQHCSSVQTLISSGKHPLISLSAVGNEIDSNEHLDSKDLATLYPVNCQSCIRVPRGCTVQLKDIPHGAEVVLPKLYIVYHLLKVVKDGGYTHVLHLQNTKELSPLDKLIVQLFGRKLGAKFKRATEEMVFHSPSRAQNILVIVTSSVSEIDVPEHSTLLVLTECVDKEFVGYMRFTGHRVKSVSTTDIFSPSHLLQVAPAFFRWLKRMKYIKPPASSLTDTREQGRCVRCVNIGSIEPTEYHVEVEENDLFRRDAVYILAGGLTGLGWDLACSMARIGAGVLVCLSRSPPTNSKIREMLALEEETGAELVWAQCDISDYNMTNKVMRKVRQMHDPKPIKGIFHSAVVYADGFYLKMTPETFEKAMIPKVKGSWNLHKLTLEDKLDHFVMHSSISSLLGNAGQTNYAAANAFMDALAYYRRAKGLPGQTINWGALDTGVLQRSSKSQDLLKSFGWVLLTKDVIVDCFINALLENRVQSLYFDIEWDIFSKIFRQRRLTYMSEGVMQGPELDKRFEKVMSLDKTYLTGLQEEADEMQRKLKAFAKLEKRQAQDLAMRIIENIVGSVLGEMVPESGPNTSLILMGLDSMFGMVLRTQMKQLLNLTVSLDVILNPNTTVQSLAALLLEDRFMDLETSGENSVPSHDQPETPDSNVSGDDKELLKEVRHHSDKDEQQHFFMTRGRRTKRVMLQIRSENKHRWLEWTTRETQKKKTISMKDISYCRNMNDRSPVFVVGYNGKDYIFRHQLKETVISWSNAVENACKEDRILSKFLWFDSEEKVNVPKEKSKKKGQAKFAKYRSLDSLQHTTKDINTLSYTPSCSTYL